MNRTQAKVCLFVAIFKFKVALLDRITPTVQTRLRSDRDYNTTIGEARIRDDPESSVHLLLNISHIFNMAAPMVKWVCQELSKLLGVDAPEDIARYPHCYFFH